MLSNCSTSSMMSFCLLILMTRAALPALRRAKRNLRRDAFSSCGISTVWDCNRELYYVPSYLSVPRSNVLLTMTVLGWIGVRAEGILRLVRSTAAEDSLMEVVQEIGSGRLYEVRSDQLGGAPDESACGDEARTTSRPSSTP